MRTMLVLSMLMMLLSSCAVGLRVRAPVVQLRRSPHVVVVTRPQYYGGHWKHVHGAAPINRHRR